MKSVLPFPAVELVPQRETMLLLGSLDSWSENVGTASADPVACPLFLRADRTLDPVAFVELAAQSIAAWDGWQSRQEGKAPAVGFLAGVRDFRLLAPALAGSRLEIRCERSTVLGEVTVVKGSVSRGGVLCAEGSLNIFDASGMTLPETPQPAPLSGVRVLFPLPALLEGGAPVTGALGAAYMGSAAAAAGWSGWAFGFDRDFPAFRGHFPAYNLLPGIVMLRTAQLACELQTGRPLALRLVERAKFTGQILPGSKAVAEVKFEPGTLAASARLSVEGKTAASFILKFEERA